MRGTFLNELFEHPSLAVGGEKGKISSLCLTGIWSQVGLRLLPGNKE